MCHAVSGRMKISSPRSLILSALAMACVIVAACSDRGGSGLPAGTGGAGIGGQVASTGGAGGGTGGVSTSAGGNGGGPMGGAGGDHYGIGTAPAALALADVDGDGRPEILVGHGGGVTVLVNQGAGKFAAGASYPTSAAVVALAVGDFNGDGRPDLAVADGGVGIFLNTGNAGFSPVVEYTVAHPFAIAIGDLDGDGRLDLAIGGDSTQILLGGASGVFALPVTVGPYTQAPVALADLAGDGKLDLIVSNPYRSIAVMRNLGQASFAAPQVYSDGVFINFVSLAVATGDLNGDGRPDIVGSWPGKDSGPGVSYVLLTTAAGVPGAAIGYNTGAILPPNPTAGPPGTGPNFVAIGDIDGDGAKDLVAANGGGNFTTGNVGLCLNHGDGTFAPARTLTTGMNPIAVAIGDVDGDGANDIVVANRGSKDVTVLRAPF